MIPQRQFRLPGWYQHCFALGGPSEVDKQLWHVVAGSREMMGGGRQLDSWLSFHFGQLLREEIRHPQASNAVPLVSTFPSRMRSLSSPAGFPLRFFFADSGVTSGVLLRLFS